MFSVQIEKVLVLDGVDISCRQVLESHGITVDERAKMSKEELKSCLKSYDAIVIRSATKVSEDVVSAGRAGRFKLISRAGTGVDNIDVQAATKYGILVMNSPDGNTVSAAEHACGLMLAVARNVAAADRSMKAGQWDRKKFTGSELNGKILGVLGVGRIGRAVAVRMQAFGMKTIGFDPLVPPAVMKENNIEPIELEELWRVSDYITVHTPLLPSTKGMVGKQALAKCKKGVCIINAARGGIVDENALLSGLESGQCRGAGLDVFEVEPPTNLMLTGHPRVTCCPHLGANTLEAQQRCGQEIGKQIVSLTQGTSTEGIINCPVLISSIASGIEPYLNLSVALGRLSAWVAGENMDFLLSVSDVLMKQHTSCLGVGLSVGLLQQLDSDIDASLVNATGLAKEKGLKVNVEFCERQCEGGLSVMVGGESSVSGVVDGNRSFITGTSGFLFELPLAVKGHVLVIRGKKPSITPQDILQKVTVNELASVLLSFKDNEWICIVQTMKKLPFEVVRQVSSQNGVVDCGQIDFTS